MISQLSHSSQLIPLLQFSTVTVVLLTANWSVETAPALASLKQASSLITCPSVQYFHLPTAVTDIHPSSDDPVGEESVTQTPPFFPCVRIYAPPAPPKTLQDSLDPSNLAFHIDSICNHLSHQALPLSRDAFAHDIRSHPYPLGALLLFPGPRPPLSLYRTVASSIVAFNQAAHRSCVFTIADSVADRFLTIRNNAPDSALIFFDLRRDIQYVWPLPSPLTQHDIISTLFAFEQGRVTTKPPQVKPTSVFAYFDKTATWQPHFEYAMDRPSLGGLLEGVFEKSDEAIAWVIVYQSWCAFCQRIMPCYQRFSKLVKLSRVDVQVLFVSNLHSLPPYIDHLVDGFPTVLMLRRVGSWTSAEEYIGRHRVSALVEMHDEKKAHQMRTVLKQHDTLIEAD